MEPSKCGISSGICLVTIPAHALPVTATVFSPDGTLVISGSDDGTVRLWSAADGSAVGTLGGQNYFIGAVAFSPDGTLCASAGGDETIQVRNAADGSLVQRSPQTRIMSAVWRSRPTAGDWPRAEGRWIPPSKSGRSATARCCNTIPATTNGVMALAWSPDGLTLAAGGDSVEQNITFWSTNGILQGTLLGTLSWHTNGVTALAFSPQGNLLASGGRRPGNMVRIWTNTIGGIWTTGTVVRTYLSTATNNNVECVTFSPDGTLVGYGRTAVNVLKIGPPEWHGLDAWLGHQSGVFRGVFAGRQHARRDGPEHVQIWTNRRSSWALFDTITNEVVRASCLAYSPNGNLLLCGREDGTLTIVAQHPRRLGPAEADVHFVQG